MRVIVTGGAGYIGTHTLVELLAEGHELLVLDNYVNSSVLSLHRVEKMTNRQFRIEEADITDHARLNDIFMDFRPEAVIHFAGLKAVGESEEKPVLYHENNVFGTIALLKAMTASGCDRMIFSSSATVYGIPHYLPYDEEHPTAPFNPYGRTKYFAEEVIRDWARIDNQRSALLLRYFNPVGAHHTGMIGEDPNGIPNNLMPFITQVAVGRREKLMVYGNDYETKDGTGVRDYIHVTDLAKGHVAALNYAADQAGIETVNLGTGRGYSVLEVVSAFITETGVDLPYEIAPRRSGDIPEFYADASKAKKLLGWTAELDLAAMVRDSWHWQSQNPNGYEA